MSVKYIYLVAIAATLGCATTPTNGGVRNSNVITEQEIVASGVSNSYEAVERLRPNFLQGRGNSRAKALVSDTTTGRRMEERTLNTNSSYPNIYIGNQRQGDISYLRQLPANTVSLIRFFKASEATTRFGMDN